MTAKLLHAVTNPRTPAAAAPSLGLAPRSRVVRDFVLLIAVCMSVGLSVGLGMMAAVFALF